MALHPRNKSMPVSVCALTPLNARMMMSSKNTFFIIGRGDNLHHLIYVDDLVTGLLQAAEHPDAANQLFVLAGPKPVTTTQMAVTIAQQLGARPPRLHAPLLPFLVLAVLLEKTLRPLGVQPPLHRRRLDFRAG